MSGSNFTRKYTISKHTGPVYINSYALNGIGVQYRNPSSSIDPVSLPPGWVPPPRLQDYKIDLSLERTVIEQAQARRRATLGEVPDPNSSLKTINNGGGLNPAMLSGATVPLIPYQSSSILTPIPVAASTTENTSTTTTTTATTTTTDTITKPLGEMSLRDFEGDTSDPFENTALQAIDDLSELQSVLQPELKNQQQQQPVQIQQALPRSNYSSSSLSTYSPPVTNQPPPVYSSSVPSAVNQPAHNNFRPPAGGVGVLVNFERPAQVSHNSPDSTVNQTSSSQPQPVTSSVPRPHPPSVSPKPRPPPPSVSPKPRPRLQPTTNNPVCPPYPGGAPVLPVNVEPRLPPYTESPYPSEELYTTVANYNPHHSPLSPLGPSQFKLPDIQNSLSVEEKETVIGLSGMGFPVPRVARAFKHFDGDSQKVLDFLFLVGELEEKGYNGDSAETALLIHDKDITKSTDYLNQVEQYKQMWSEEAIHNAYRESGKDWDKTLDKLSK